MKKILALLMAGMLLVGASMTAFAEPSPSAPTGGSNIIVDSDPIDKGYIVISYDYKTAEDAAAAKAIQSDLASALKQAGITDSNLELYTVFDASIVGNYDIQGHLYLTFAVADLTPDTKAYVLHYINGKWENVTYKVGTNQITGMFSSLSPVAIVVEKDAVSDGAGTEGESPKTGDTATNAMPGVIAAVLVAAVAGVTVSTRRRRA